MELYYKLLNLTKGKYTTHETLEEVHHYITHCVSDMQYDYKFTDKQIRTPFPNYDFHHVIVEDENESREFLYFFDTIEEEFDSRDDDRDEILEQRDRAIDLLNKKTTDLFNANRLIDSLRHRLSECESALEHAECFVTGHKDEAESLKQENERLIAELEKSKRTNSYLREHNQNLKEILNKINDLTHPF